ncbi:MULTISPECIES: hypothetical protein [Nostocales]|uniref:hypothetical protein n=1 Tax=Nostocales TaxID=1161 RepID=UPI00144797F2|nr:MULTISPECIES: hypothetical protein [Nostocales]MBO1064963.1 hypothetical protein [Anabaena sp. 54]
MSNLFTAVSAEQQEIVAGGKKRRDAVSVIKSFNDNFNSQNGSGNTKSIVIANGITLY